MPTDKKSLWKRGKEFYKSKTGRLIDAAMWGPLLYEGAKWSWGGKEGGRVRGVGEAKRGYGKAMRKK